MKLKSGRRLVATTTAAAALGLTLISCGDNASPVAAPGVELVSSRADMVSGGDALLGVTLPAGTAATDIVVTVNGARFAATFKPDPQNAAQQVGLVTGLREGANTITVSAGGDAARLEVKNFPRSGPIISGPHIKPYICQTDQYFLPDGTTLGAALDENCSAPTNVHYVYMSSADGKFKTMPDTTRLPADVATTRILTGASVPYVVRLETGTIDRGVYHIAILHNPASEPTPSPAAQPAGWNKRLVWLHGFGCTGGWYHQGTTTGSLDGVLAARSGEIGLAFNVLVDPRLKEGYAVASNTLSHPSVSCNPILAGEGTAMTKERFIEGYGKPLFTASAGTSGGAYSSLQIADAFPGLFDGILIGSVFPDALSIGLSGLDARLVTNYFRATDPGGFTAAQQQAVGGFITASALVGSANQSGRTDPITGRVDNPGYNAGSWTAVSNRVAQPVPASLRYHPVNNPTGARPTIFDLNVNAYGRNAATGFANRPYDNTGVQYGLGALNAGAITVQQFLDLNERIGGYDQDANYVAARSQANEAAIQRAYQSGIHLGGGGGLASIPVFDYGNYSDDSSDYHLQWYHFATRERMVKANGDASNFVFWRGHGARSADLIVPPAQPWGVFEQWMTAVKTDAAPGTAKEKVVRNKPAAAVDGCYAKDAAFTLIREAQTFGTTGSTCNTLWPSSSNPRKVAGGPLAADILKCQLKPVAPGDYSVGFTPAETTRLAAVFRLACATGASRVSARSASCRGHRSGRPSRTWFSTSRKTERPRPIDAGQLALKACKGRPSRFILS